MSLLGHFKHHLFNGVFFIIQMLSIVVFICLIRRNITLLMTIFFIIQMLSIVVFICLIRRNITFLMACFFLWTKKRICKFKV